MTGRRARRIGVAAGGGGFLRKERFALAAAINEPTVAPGIVINPNAITVRFAQINTRQVGDFKFQLLERGRLLGR